MEGEKEARAINLGRMIVKLRKQRGWTQGQLAYQAKVERPWLSKVENGRITGTKGPGLGLLLRVANALGADPAQFWRELGIQEADLLTDHPEAFQRDVIDFAVWLQTLDDESRIAVINGFRALKHAAEVMASQYPQQEPPTPLPPRSRHPRR